MSKVNVADRWLVSSLYARARRLEDALRALGESWCREHCDHENGVHTEECETAYAALLAEHRGFQKGGSAK